MTQFAVTLPLAALEQNRSPIQFARDRAAELQHKTNRLENKRKRRTHADSLSFRGTAIFNS